MAEAPGTHNPQFLPPGIPAPQDDGAARHLAGMKLPDLRCRRPPARPSTCRSSRAAPSSTSIRAPACPASMRRRAGTTSRARAAARRNPAASATISPISSGWAWSSFTDCPRRIPPISRKRRRGCICRSRSCPMRNWRSTKAHQAADLHDLRHDAVEAHGAGDRRRRPSPRRSIRYSRPTRTPRK